MAVRADQEAKPHRPHRNNSSLHCPLALPCKQGRFYLGKIASGGDARLYSSQSIDLVTALFQFR